MTAPIIIGWDLASGPDVSITTWVRVPLAPKVINLARYRKAKMWREFKRRLDAGLYLPPTNHQ